LELSVLPNGGGQYIDSLATAMPSTNARTTPT